MATIRSFIDEDAAKLILTYELSPMEFEAEDRMASLFESPEKFERRARAVRRRRGSPRARRAPTFERFENENDE